MPPAELEAHIDLSGVAGNFWVGLALLHSLFMREHNAICDHLHAKYRDLDDETLYQKARLVNAALMAKIHTVDWTPAVIAHPTTVIALRANWWGILGEGFVKRFGRRTSNEVLRGIPGSPTDHHTAPYSLTEEFVAVYRMHPLIPDDYTFRSVGDDGVLQERTLEEIGALDVRARLDEMPMTDVLYSFGRMHPGAIELHNFPRFLQHFKRPAGDEIDLAAIDVIRTRERGVPRYNQFRRLFHLKPVESFREMTDNPEWAEELEEVYGDVERVDHMVGMYAEPKPRGFGFSDTAFRVFILMASRRLKSDRFFTRDYRPEVYTKAGIDWLEGGTTRCARCPAPSPELEPALQGVGTRARAGRVGDTARVTLAAVRLFNGGASLVAPRMFAQRLGRESDADGAAVHALRMFGIRTVLIALDLMSRDPAVRRHALRFSVLIQATDTVSAVWRAGTVSCRRQPRAWRPASPRPTSCSPCSRAGR